MPNRYDISLDGTDYRLIRGEDSYKQGAIRSMVDFQEIDTMPGSQLSSRNDVRTMYQTSWAGGSRWEKPLLGGESIDSYYTNTNFDMLIEPGTLVPRKNVTSSLAAPVAPWSEWVQVNGTTAYAVGEAGTTYKKMLKWVSGTITTLTQHSNSANANQILDICWDGENDTLYVADHLGISYVTPGSGQGAVVTLNGTWGASIFMHMGELRYWNGDKLYKISDPLGTPSSEIIYDDGFGWTWLYDEIDYSGSHLFIQPHLMRHAISTSDGVYVVKNVSQGGSVMAYVYRVDRDASGTNIGTPVATLDPGYTILDIYWSLGSLLMSATSDIGRLTNNDSTAEAARVEFFHLTDGSLGSIGTPVGRHPDELVFKMLLTSQRSVYIGGSTNVWAYDPIRGGVHMLHEDTNITDGCYHSGILDTNGVTLFHSNKSSSNKTILYLADALPSSTGAYLESNYFDFSLPGEKKWITSVTFLTSDVDTNESWGVWIEVDGGSFVHQAAYNTNTASPEVTLAAPVGGRRFRYRVGYASSGSVTSPSKMRGVIIKALSGDLTPYWQMTIDGTEARNVENGVIRPEDVFGNLKTLRDDKTPVTFKDTYQSDDRSSSSTYTVRVQSVTIIKEEPKEARIQVVLVGV